MIKKRTEEEAARFTIVPSPELMYEFKRKVEEARHPFQEGNIPSSEVLKELNEVLKLQLKPLKIVPPESAKFYKIGNVKLPIDFISDLDAYFKTKEGALSEINMDKDTDIYRALTAFSSQKQKEHKAETLSNLTKEKIDEDNVD